MSLVGGPRLGSRKLTENHRGKLRQMRNRRESMQTMTRFVGGLVVLLVATVAAAHKVEILDDCAPNADWGVNGCLLEEGDVTRSEFDVELLSPLADAVIG